MANFIELDTIEVRQPFGTFFLVSITAEDLLEVCFTDPFRYEYGQAKGNQRALDEKSRIAEIREFVQGYDAGFPNAIIISANYDINGFNTDIEEDRWKIENKKLIIPSNKKLASIIDGQHRLFAFKDANPEAKKMQLACSIYLDLPNALQAFLFATINSNQKPVDKSLAYEQFGFDIEKEDPKSWPPDKLAIALYKRLNSQEDSPFYEHIKIAPQVDDYLKERLKNQKWLISTATIVDGIIRLISTNPKFDKYQLQKLVPKERKRTILGDDNSPLRALFLENNDVVIYKIVFNYFKAAANVLFDNAPENSSIFKTIGIQGLFDALKRIITFEKENNDLKNINFSIEKYTQVFTNVSTIDFTNPFYQYSAVGKSHISETILLLNNYITTPAESNGDARIEKKITTHNDIRNLLIN